MTDRPDRPEDAWKTRPQGQEIAYASEESLATAVERLRVLPPLVTSWEIERLRVQLAEAAAGQRFVLMGGDCAETFADCRPDVITRKVKILLQMALVLVHGGQKPVTRVGRIAGQYAKPRSQPTETRVVDGVARTLPSYFGDLVNGAEFDAAARTPDPERLLHGYHHAALSLNFVRSLSEGGFADVHHPEYWDLGFVQRAGLSQARRDEYARLRDEVADALRFMEALGESPADQLSRTRLFTCHEGYSLPYESAQTRHVPRRPGRYDLSTHLPWIGERTRAVDGAHVAFFAGVANPVGVKLGPTTTPDEVLALAEVLDPAQTPGRLLLITRLGVDAVERVLPPLIAALARKGRRAVWVCDPMHGNTVAARSGVKTRRFEDVIGELMATFDVHAACGSELCGVHVELTGEHVTECIGGGVAEEDLEVRYESPCDPRLNYGQALELAFRIAQRMRARRSSQPAR